MKHAVLLVAHGTPEKPGDIPEYMKNVTGGRPIPDSVMEEVTHRYGLIGRSPLTDITMMQAEGLQQRLHERVYIGMRNWRPFIADTVKQMLADHVTTATVICLAPQNSRTSVGLYKRAVLAASGDALQLEFVDSWHDQPKLIKAFAQRLLAARNAAPDATVLFTAHSVPCRTINGQNDGDPYSVQCKHTAALVAQGAGLQPSEWVFAFQSQGMSGGPWIGPTVESTLDALATAGKKSVLMQPIGFVCDHVEVLYDIDIAFRQHAEKRGMALSRAESLNDSPLFIDALAELAVADHKPVSVAVS